MHKSLIVLTVLITSFYIYAEEFEIKEGTYASANGNFEFSVRKDSFARDGLYQDWYKISGQGIFNETVALIHFYFDPLSGNASKSPWRRGLGKTMIGNHVPSGDFRLIQSSKYDGVLSFVWKLGGTMAVENQKLKMDVDLATGEILSLGTKHKIAVWNSPSGWHSGPLKYSNSHFYFGDFKLQVKTSLNDLKLIEHCNEFLKQHRP
jgi:hypothetical protein